MLIRSFFYYIYFFITAAIGFFVALLLRLLTLPFDPHARLLDAITARWAYHYLLINPYWKIHWQGIENILPGQTYVIIANHQSAIDGLLLYGLPLHFKWLAKPWVFKFPIIGSLLRLSAHVETNPADPSKTLRSCEDTVRQGVSLLVFAEGTRSENGQLQPFKKGGFTVATRANLPVLPVVLDGTRGILPKRGRGLSARAEVEVSVLKPIFPRSDAGALLREVRAAIATELTRLRQKQQLSSPTSSADTIGITASAG